MEKQIPLPAVLYRKVFFTLITGAGSFLIALAVYANAGDLVLLWLGITLLLFCIGKGWLLWHSLSLGDYETIIGVCTEKSYSLLCRCCKVSLVIDNGTQLTLMLRKQSQITIGSPYRFYFRKSNGIRLENENLNSMITTHLRLGYEELSSYALEGPVANTKNI